MRCQAVRFRFSKAPLYFRKTARSARMSSRLPPESSACFSTSLARRITFSIRASATSSSGARASISSAASIAVSHLEE